MNNKNKMENKVTIYKHGKSGYVIVFSEQSLNIIKTNELFFDKRLLKFRLPNYDDNKIYKLNSISGISKYKDRIYNYKSKTKRFSFGNSNFNPENVGKYILEKDDEWFFLIKQ